MSRAITSGLALLAGLGGGCAGATASTVIPAGITCWVERAEKLPPELSADALCGAVQRAVAPALARAGLKPSALSVRITVDSERKLSAIATLNGTALPEHHVGVSDRALNPGAAAMLGAAIAGDVTSGRR